MKKIICSVLIVLVTMIQFLTVFADTPTTVSTMKWSDIEEYVFDYSPDIKANSSSITDNTVLSNSLNSMNSLKTSVNATISDIQSKLSGTLSASEVDIYTKLLTLYNVYSEQLQGQISSVQNQLNNSSVGSFRNMMANYAIVNNAQQLFILYSSLQLQREDLDLKVEQFKSKVNIAKLQMELGMISEADLEDMIIALEEQDDAIKALDENMENIKSQFNIILGQNFNYPITFGELPTVDDSILLSMNYDKDMETGRLENFNIRMLSLSDTSNIDNQTRKYKFTFDQKYKDVKNCKKALDNETSKLGREEKKLNKAKLKYDAGLISKVDLEMQSYAFKSQVLKVKTAQKDLLQSYTSYKWLLQGYETLK